MKKSFSIVCSLVIIVASMCSCFAATDLDALKKDVLSSLGSGVTTQAGATLQLPQEYINKAESYLNQNDFSEDQLNQIITRIDTAKATVAESNATSLSELRKDTETFNNVMTTAKEAAKAANLILAFDGNHFKLVDENGNELLAINPQNNDEGSGDVIKTTGLSLDASTLVIASSVVGLLLVVSGVIIFKKKLYKHETV